MGCGRSGIDDSGSQCMSVIGKERPNDLKECILVLVSHSNNSAANGSTLYIVPQDLLSRHYRLRV
jgi:hypothetical protein